MRPVKAILAVVVVVAMFIAAFRVVPPYFNNYQLQDEIESIARLNTYSNKSEDEIRDMVLKKAKEYEVPVTAEQVKVNRTGQEIAISAKYMVHVNLPGYPLDLHFNPHTANAGASQARP